MRKLLLVLTLFATVNVSAQISEVADSVSVDSTDTSRKNVTQVPLDVCDSLMARDVCDSYGVVYKDGKCGIYDIVRNKNVTEIEYLWLRYAYRREIEGGFYSYFYWKDDENAGIIGIVETDNHFLKIIMPKEE